MIDAHNACPACPIIVRAMYESVCAHLAVLELVDDPTLVHSGAFLETRENLRIAVGHLRPHVEAHLENHLHALSPELASARGQS